MTEGRKRNRRGVGTEGGAGGGRGRKLERKRKPGGGIRKSTLTSAVRLVHPAALGGPCRLRPCVHRRLQAREKGSVTISPHGVPRAPAPGSPLCSLGSLFAAPAFPRAPCGVPAGPTGPIPPLFKLPRACGKTLWFGGFPPVPEECSAGREELGCSGLGKNRAGRRDGGGRPTATGTAVVSAMGASLQPQVGCQVCSSGDGGREDGRKGGKEEKKRGRRKR